MKQLSVIIPCHNEGATISRLLEMLIAQTEAPDEVLVVDSASTDDTPAVAAGFVKRLPPLQVIKGPIGPAAARNAGAAAATGDWLLFLDADVSIGPEFIAETRRQITRTTRPGLKGFHFYPVSPHWYDYAMQEIYFAYCRLTSLTRSPNFPGFAMLIPRELHEKIRGFNTRLTNGEDFDYARRAVHRGTKVEFLNSPRLGESMRRMDREGRVNLLAKYFRVEFIRLMHSGKIKKIKIDYEFGDFHQPAKPAKKG